MCKVDSRNLKVLHGRRISNRYGFAAPTALTAKRALRAVRPFAPTLSRSYLLAFLLAQFFHCYTELSTFDSMAAFDTIFAAAAFLCGVLFIGLQGSWYPFYALCAYFVYGFLTAAHFGLAALQLTHGLSLAVMQLSGNGRIFRLSTANITAYASQKSSPTAHTVISPKDFAYALTRCAIGMVLVDASLGVCGYLVCLTLPVAFAFAVGYYARPAAMAATLCLTALALYTLGFSSSETSLGASGLDILPEISASLLMLCGGSGAFTVDEVQAGRDGLVY
jgi:hypothetical protein